MTRRIVHLTFLSLAIFGVAVNAIGLILVVANFVKLLV